MNAFGNGNAINTLKAVPAPSPGPLPNATANTITDTVTP